VPLDTIDAESADTGGIVPDGGGTDWEEGTSRESAGRSLLLYEEEDSREKRENLRRGIRGGGVLSERGLGKVAVGMRLPLLTAKDLVPCHSTSCVWSLCGVDILSLGNVGNVGSTVTSLPSEYLRLRKSVVLTRLPNPSLGIWTRK